MAKKAQVAISNANQVVKRTANMIDKLDKKMNGMILQNPIAGAIVPYVNYAAKGLDLVDELMTGYSGLVTHPQGAGQGAVTSYNFPVRRAKPKFASSRGEVRITHKELISSVNMNTALSVTPVYSDGRSIYQVNAACPSLFPWLSTIALNYDFYRFNRLSIVYVPLCSTATSGRIMLGFDPDGADPLPVDRQALSSTACSAEMSAWAVQDLKCELPHLTKWFNTSNTGDAGLPGQGQIFAAAWGGSDTALVGEVYVLYDVTLKSPQPTNTSFTRITGNGTSLLTQAPQFLQLCDVTSTSTSLVINFLATGVYIVTITADATALTSQTVAGSTTLISYSRGVGAAGSTSVGVVSITSLGQSIDGVTIANAALYTVSGLTALGKWNVLVTRIPRDMAVINTDHPTGA